MVLVLPWIFVPALLRRKTHHAKNLTDSGLSLSKARMIFNGAFSRPVLLPDGSSDGNGKEAAVPPGPSEKKSEWIE